MKHLFAYGTLMCDEIMTSVTGVSSNAIPTVLEGYQRFRIKHEVYPGIISNKGQLVEGMLYHDLPLFAWDNLDRFEGALYIRKTVDLKDLQGQLITADTYVIHPDYIDRLENKPWNYQEFLDTSKHVFQQSYDGYDSFQANYDND